MTARNLILGDPAYLRAAQPPAQTAFVELFNAGGGFFNEISDPGQPTHYYAFQTTDVSGSTVLDRGSGGQDGTITAGGLTTTVKSGDGALAGVMTVPSGVLDFNNEDWSVGCWYQATNGAGNQQVIGNRNGTTGTGWHAKSFNYFGNSTFNFGIEAGGTSMFIGQGLAQGRPVGDHNTAGLANRVLYDFGGWVFCCLTFNNSTGNLRVYVDNGNFSTLGPILRYDNTNASLIGGNFTSGATGTIGARPDNTEQLGNRVDDVFVYRNRLLTQGEITYIMNETTRGRLLV